MYSFRLIHIFVELVTSSENPAPSQFSCFHDTENPTEASSEIS
jgi:hypothetical protein